MSAVRVGRVRGGLLGLLVCLAVSLLLAAVTPDPATDERRRYAEADVGAVAVTDDVSARVVGVQVGTSAQRSYGEPFTSAERLVVVDLEASVRHRVVYFRNVWLETRDGRRYEPRPEFASAALTQTQPGFTRRAALVFELPTDRVGGSRLVLDADGGKFDVYSSAVRVDLGLRSEDVTSTAPIPVVESAVTVTP